MSQRPNQPADGFRMTDPLPGRMTLAELLTFQGSRYVLAPRPRRSKFAPNGMGFYHGQRVYLYEGTLVPRDGYYVAPPNALSYRLVGECTVLDFDDDSLHCVLDAGSYPQLFALAKHFALDAALCNEVLGGSRTAQYTLAVAPVYSVKKGNSDA